MAGAVLFGAVELLGKFAVGRGANEQLHHVVGHFLKVPLGLLALSLLGAVLTQTGFGWVLSKRLNGLLVKVLAYLLQGLSHLFSGSAGGLLVYFVISGHVVDAFSSQGGGGWDAVVAWLLLDAAGFCGYVCSSVARFRVGLDGRSNQFLAVGVALLAGALLLGWLLS